MRRNDLRVGACYAGRGENTRQITAIRQDENTRWKMYVYWRRVAGHGKESGYSLLTSFASWAKHKVECNEEG